MVNTHYNLSLLRGKRICRIATVPFTIASHLKGQVEFLKTFGADVVLVSSPGSELRKINIGENLRHVPIEIPRAISPLKDLRALISLIMFFRKNNFDIVHSTTPKAGLLTALATWINRVPVRLHTWTGQQWVTLKGPVRFFSIIADRLVGLLNTRCYADSQSQKMFLINERIVSPKKISVIGGNSLSGVNMDRFNPNLFSDEDKQGLRRKLGINSVSCIIVFVGRVTRDKGVYELLGAFDRLRSAGYQTDLLLVGPLDEDCGGVPTISRQEIETHSHVHLTGYTETPEKFLAISDIFCLPSYREGFGSVVIEAAAMGLPAVGTRITGLIDAIEEDQTGVLVPPRNVSALANELQALMDDPEKVKKMGQAARQRCREYFSDELINHALAEEYLQLIGRG